MLLCTLSRFRSLTQLWTSFSFQLFLFTMSIALTFMLLYSLLNIKLKFYRNKMCFYRLCCRDLRSNAMKYRMSIEEQLGIPHQIAIFRCGLQSLKLLSGLVSYSFLFLEMNMWNFFSDSFVLYISWSPLYIVFVVNRVILTLLEVHLHWQRLRLSRYHAPPCCTPLSSPPPSFGNQSNGSILWFQLLIISLVSFQKYEKG